MEKFGFMKGYCIEIRALKVEKNSWHRILPSVFPGSDVSFCDRKFLPIFAQIQTSVYRLFRCLFPVQNIFFTKFSDVCLMTFRRLNQSGIVY